MSWRFSSTYTPRDLSSTRDSSTKYGVSSIASKFGSLDSSERQSRWSKTNSTLDSPRTFRTSSSTTDHSPIWAKSSISDSSSSLVQRLKERYNANDAQKTDKYSDIRSMKRTETKDLSNSLPPRTYGRTETTELKKETASYGSYNRTDSSDNKKEVKDYGYGSYKRTDSTDTKKDYGYGSYSRTDSTDTKKDYGYGSYGRTNSTETKKDYGYGSYNRTNSAESKKDSYSTKTDENDVYSRFRKRQEKSPEPEKTSTYEYKTRRPDFSSSSNYGPLENRSKIYTSSSLGSSPATTRYLSKKYNDTSPTTVTSTFNFTPKQAAEPEEETVTVVTRGTSPTEPSASVYVRTRRADLSKGIEKKIPKVKTKPEVIDKEVQTEKPEEPTSPTSPTSPKYNCSDTNSRVKPWSSYYSSGSSSFNSTSRFSRYGSETRREPSILISYPSRYETARSISREEQHEEPEVKSPEPLVTKPPKAVSPVKEIARKTETETIKSVAKITLAKEPDKRKSSERDTSSASSDIKKSSTRKSLSSDTRKSSEPSSSSSDIKKSSTRKSLEPNSSSSDVGKSGRKSTEMDTSSSYDNIPKPPVPNKSPSPLQFKLSPEPEVKTEPPKIKSPTPKSQSVTECSSTSESSSEEETSSESESEEEKEQPTTTSAASSVKRSITNFLQNIPSYLSRKPTSSTESINRSKPNLYQKLARESGSTAKIKFKRIESGEKAWWMDSSNEKIPDGVTKVMSNRSVGKTEENEDTKRFIIPKQYSQERDWWLKDDDENQLNKSNNQSRSSFKNLPPRVPSTSHTNTLAPPHLINRQYSPDKDWLKGSTEDLEAQEQIEKAKEQIDNSASILKQCNGDNTWWVDKNENITNEAPTGFRVRKIWSEEKPWWLNETSSDGNVNHRIVANGHYDGSISVDEGFSVSNNLDVINSGKDTNSINEAGCDQVCGKWVSDGVTIAQNEFPSKENHLKSTINDSVTQERNNNLEEDGEESFDVTPALRRRREQHRGSKSPDNYHPEDYQMKFNQNLETTEQPNETKKYLEDFQLECSVKDLTQKLVSQNGLSSPLEEKNNNLLEVGDMSGMISKAKAGLIKSKTKQDIRKSSSGEMSPKPAEINKAEIDLYWKELVDSINRPLRLCDLDFTDLNTDDETDVFGNSRVNGDVPPPPPLLIMPLPIRNDMNVPTPPSSMFKISKAPAPPPMNQIVKNKKTVKLFWKEVKDDPIIRAKSPNGAPLIWDELTRVTVDTQKLEHLFESRAKDLATKKQQDQNKSKEVIVLDHKRSNAINIGMTKLPPPRAIKTAILKMDSTVVNKEGIEKLLTMLPTDEERIRIQDAQSANPDLPLGSAEQFLLTLASISELEARLKLWAFKLDFENSEKEICEPLMDLKQGIEILRVNKTFRGILSTLLSIGNFLNGYDVKGFQIDYLSKVPEVKDTVHKHSLLHHLCVIVMEKFPDSTDLYSEIGAVTRASKVDFDELAANIKKVEDECKLSWNYLKIIAKHEGHTTMKMKMSDFLADCAERIIVLGIVHKRVISRFQKFIFWLGIPMNRISTTRPNEIFKIISEFALEYRTTRERVLQQVKKMNHRERSRTRGYQPYQPHENNDVAARKMNSKEAKDDAKLRQLLGNDTTHSENMHHASTWRRHRKETRNLTDETNHNDDEIIETLIKTANQIPSNRASMKERRRSRIERNKY